jgi:hypothetical protein
MTALTSALDKMEALELGENNSLEYGWKSNNVQELITQFQFQLVRSKNIEGLKREYEKILKLVFIGDVNLEYVKVIYKLIGYTRDIVAGKGEYSLTYMLISELYNFADKYKDKVDKDKIEIMCKEVLKSLVVLDNGEHPYGSYKDLKYFCNYHLKNTYERIMYTSNIDRDPLIEVVIKLICERLKIDEESKNKSLLAKWIPREKSNKFGWITPIIAKQYYSEWFDNHLGTMSDAQRKAATRKALTHFRQLISRLNKELNTVQVYQCSNDWKDINFDKNVTSITMRKQSGAFNMVSKRGKDRYIYPSKLSDRVECKEHYQKYLNDCREGKKRVKGARVSLVDFVKDALHYLSYMQWNENSTTDERDLLNMQWNENSKQNNSLGNVIAMVDTSASMDCDNSLPLYSAIGLGLRVAEKSKLGKRVMTFSAKPEWVNLDGLDFVGMIEKIKEAEWGMNTNFDAALDMILNTAIVNNISPFEMQNFTLLICSDMQIDQCRTDYSGTMFDRIEKKYADAGINSVYKTPYPLPHIVFWNLRSTTGFPSLSSTPNTSMLSGNSPVLLNAFSENGSAMLKDITPWNVLVNELNNNRYNKLEEVVVNLWNEPKISLYSDYMLD